VVKSPGIPETTINLEAAMAKMREDGNFQVYLLTQPRTLLMMESKIGNLTAHDFDDAIAALKAADKIADRAKGAELYHGDIGNNGMPPRMSTEDPAVTEPMHPDFQKIKGAMGKQYGNQADDVYYAYLNKHGLDDKKPFPATEISCPHGQMLNECPECNAEDMLGQQTPSAPQNPLQQGLARQNTQTGQQGYGLPGNLARTPAQRGVPAPQPPGLGTGVGQGPGVNADPHLGGTGAPGVTGTSNLTPMQGTNVNPPQTPRIQNPYLQPRMEVKEAKGNDCSPDTNLATAIVEDKTRKFSEGNVSSAQDPTLDKAHSAPQKAIGLAATPYEQAVLDKLSKGEPLTEEESKTYEAIKMREKYIEVEKLPGGTRTVGNRVSTMHIKEEEKINKLADADDVDSGKMPTRRWKITVTARRRAKRSSTGARSARTSSGSSSTRLKGRRASSERGSSHP